MPVEYKPCQHCGEHAPKYYDDDEVLRCFVCRKATYGEFRKFCQTCNRMVPYKVPSNEAIIKDTCYFCGDIVIGQAIPYVLVNDDDHGHAEQDMDIDPVLNEHAGEEVCITPAREIYKQNNGTSLWFIRGLYDEFRFQWKESKNPEIKIQAWQYVKACVQLLKERDDWEHWTDLEHGTPEWKEYWKQHPEDQEDMAAHSRYQKEKHSGNYCWKCDKETESIHLEMYGKSGCAICGQLRSVTREVALNGGLF